jgi:hypothetical protein
MALSISSATMKPVDIHTIHSPNASLVPRLSPELPVGMGRHVILGSRLLIGQAMATLFPLSDFAQIKKVTADEQNFLSRQPPQP